MGQSELILHGCDAMTFSAPQLSFCRYVFACEALSSLQFKKFPGAELRDAFGLALKTQRCTRRRRDGTPESEAFCAGCECDYGQIFNPVENVGPHKRIDSARPYLLDAAHLQSELLPFEQWSFGVTLIGRLQAIWPVFVQAFEWLGKRGLGWNWAAGAGRFRVLQVTALDNEALENEEEGSRAIPLWDATTGSLRGDNAVANVFHWARCEDQAQHFSPRRLTIALQSPLQLRQSHRHQFQFSDLWNGLTTRLQTLSHAYCGAAIEADFVRLARLSQSIRVQQHLLHWQRQSRFSYEKEEVVSANGWIGQITFEGDLRPFLPALVAGQWLGVGRHCVLGNGQYRLIMN